MINWIKCLFGFHDMIFVKVHEQIHDEEYRCKHCDKEKYQEIMH